jgi:type IV pilus assembly protein PilB
MKLGEILIAAKATDAPGIENGLAHAKLTKQRLGSALIDLNVVSADIVARALAKQRGVAAALESHFAAIASNPALAELVPAAIARERVLVPLEATAGDILVAMADPKDLGSIDAVAFATGRAVKPAAASMWRIKVALNLLYGHGQAAAPTASTPAARAAARAATRGGSPRRGWSTPTRLALLAILAIGGGVVLWNQHEGAVRGRAIVGRFDNRATGLALELPDDGWRYVDREDERRDLGEAIVRTSLFYRGVDADAPEVVLQLASLVPAEPFAQPMSDAAFATLAGELATKLADGKDALGTRALGSCQPSSRRPGQLVACTGDGTYRKQDVALTTFVWLDPSERAIAATFMSPTDAEAVEQTIDQILPTIVVPGG